MQKRLLEIVAILAVPVTIYWLIESPGCDSILGLLAAVAFVLGLEFKSPQESLIISGIERVRRRAGRRLAQLTYLEYRDKDPRRLRSPSLISHFERRYNCSAFRLADTPVPAVVLWENRDQLIHPDSVLGTLDLEKRRPLDRSSRFDSAEYAKARAFIKNEYENEKVKYEGLDYCMTYIDLSSGIPKIHGTTGWYYDNILGQYAMEWELNKALLQLPEDCTDNALSKGHLPLREGVEKGRNPMVDGRGRCAAITVSTLTVFRRRDRYWCLIARRSGEVGVSKGLLHVAPAGMFEAPNLSDHWSVEVNVWRELLEEVYNEKEEHGSGRTRFLDGLYRKEPVRFVRQLLSEGKGDAELSVTGVCCDLLNLRTEICTVLFVRDPRFCEMREPQLNWEYEDQGPTGQFAVQWDSIDNLARTEARGRGFVASGAVCLGLGRRWIAERHHM